MNIKTLLFSLLLVTATTSMAQADNNNLFNCDVGILIPYAPGDRSAGFGGYVEPKFNVTNHIAVGFKSEGYVSFGGRIANIDYGDFSFRMTVMTGMALTGDYIFLEETFRPFAGFGFGRYTYASQSVSTSYVEITQEAGISWGICPRVGIQLGAFRLSCEYNILFKPSTYVYQQVSVGGPPTQGKLSRNYFGFKIGGVIGFSNE
ncbi:hypothetical protein JYT25_00060 [bacterium AH-315-C20]|nr:hypothetical protein [bacterium AH-315-C20]